MSVKRRTKEAVWFAADATYDQAEARALEALRAAMPAGRHVAWRHGRHDRMGEVIDVIGFTYNQACVRVRTIGGKVVDVHAPRVLRYMSRQP